MCRGQRGGAAGHGGGIRTHGGHGATRPPLCGRCPGHVPRGGDEAEGRREQGQQAIRQRPAAGRGPWHSLRGGGAWPTRASGQWQPPAAEPRLTAPPSAALDLLQQQARFPTQHRRLSLGCPVLDGLLGGGLPLDGITELAGSSSAGKTQLALQLCLAVQFPPRHGGLEAGEWTPPRRTVGPGLRA